MQSIEFIGHLVADPTAKSIPSGTSLTTFTVGVTRAYKNANGDKVSDFFRVNAWRQQAEYAAKYLAKGMRVYVRGELQPVIFDGKDGKARLDLSVQADRIEALSEKKAETKPTSNQPKVDEWQEITSADVPF